MKRLFFAAIAALAIAIGVSAAIVNHKSDAAPTANQVEPAEQAATTAKQVESAAELTEPTASQSEITAETGSNSGTVKASEARPVSKGKASADASSEKKTNPASDATVEYVIPNITSGSIKLDHFRKIYNLMPNDIHQQAAMAFHDIANNPKSDFRYAGVRIKHTANTWEFYYKGGSVIVRNASDAELKSIFIK
jgi:hypothetical protein